MYKEHSGLLGEHVTVDRSHLNVVLSQLSYQRIHFVVCHEKVARDRGLAAACRLEADRIRASHRRDDRHAIFGSRLLARHGELIHATIWLPLEADDLIELCGIEINGGRGR